MFDLGSLKEIKTIKQTERQKVTLVEDAEGNKYLKREIEGDKREIYKTLLQIEHPAIPKIYSVEFDDVTVVTEEYIYGVTLSECMERKDPFCAKDIKYIAKQILDGLDAIHKANIIHRDIKPDNILIDDKKRIRLTDYDISRIYRKDIRRDTETMGTFGYAPIEQYGMLPTDFKTDIYAFGVTLKALLDWGNVKGNLLKTAEKCTRLDPAERYRSAREVKKAIAHSNLRYSLITLSVIIIVLAMCFFFFGGNTVIEDNAVKEPIATDITTPDHIEEPEKEIKGDNSNNGNEPHNTEKEIPPESEKTVPEVEEVDFEGTFSGFPDGTNEELYKNLNYYSQVCIFKMESPWEHIIFIDDINKKGKIKVGKNNIIDADITLNEGVLSVNLDDKHGHTFSHRFRFENQYEYRKDYTDNLRKNADIICYDFNDDGATELIIGLNEASMGSYGKMFYNNVNYCIAWCITYDANTGFSLCKQDMFSKGYSFWTNNILKRLNVYWENPGDITGYEMEGNKIICDR